MGDGRQRRDHLGKLQAEACALTKTAVILNILKWTQGSAEMIQETLDIIDILTPTGRQSGSIAALFDKEWQKFHKTLH